MLNSGTDTDIWSTNQLQIEVLHYTPNKNSSISLIIPCVQWSRNSGWCMRGSCIRVVSARCTCRQRTGQFWNMLVCAGWSWADAKLSYILFTTLKVLLRHSKSLLKQVNKNILHKPISLTGDKKKGSYSILQQLSIPLNILSFICYRWTNFKCSKKKKECSLCLLLYEFIIKTVSLLQSRLCFALRCLWHAFSLWHFREKLFLQPFEERHWGKSLQNAVIKLFSNMPLPFPVPPGGIPVAL